MSERKYQSLKEFYPFYLTEHSNCVSRALHFTGTGLVFVLFFASIILQKWWGFALIPVVGYGFAWIGHFFFEKNKPATFQYPVYSLVSDFKMFFDILIGKESIKSKK